MKMNVSTDGTTWNDGSPTYANLGGLIADPVTAGPGVHNNWNVPDIMSNTAKIRICKNLLGSVDTEACDESGQFNIIGSITNVYVKNTAGPRATPIRMVSITAEPTNPPVAPSGVKA